MGIETICEGGFGGSASVFIQTRNEFEGLGGMITTTRSVIAAYRQLHGGMSLEQISSHTASPEPQHTDARSRDSTNMFLRHGIVKKLEDYFFRIGRYRFAHIPRPLGSTDDGYLYEWTYGSEGFCWEYIDEEYRSVPITLDEWNIAVGLFSEAGVSLSYDITDADDARTSKNIILSEQGLPAVPTEISKLWKRIDFGSESLPIDYDKVLVFIKNNHDKLMHYLKPDRVDFMELAAQYLQGNCTPETFPFFDKLRSLAYAFRMSTLSHLSTQQTIMPDQFRGFDTEYLSPLRAHALTQVSSSKRFYTGTNLHINLDITSGFKSVDGTIFTLQEQPVAHVHLHDVAPGAGFELFLRHFIIRKLEDAFISQKRYLFAHIPRPVGSNATSYSYVWAHGNTRCPLDLVKDAAPSGELSEWADFVRHFDDAGIDMRSGIVGADVSYCPYALAKQIVIKQPSNNREPAYFSIMWKRIGFSEQRTPIDFDRLELYLKRNQSDIENPVAPGRFNTMMLALQYLKGDKLSNAAVVNLILGIHDYRLSALRHINHNGFGIPAPGFVDLRVEYARIIDDILHQTLQKQGFTWNGQQFEGLSDKKYEEERVKLMQGFLRSFVPKDNPSSLSDLIQSALILPDSYEPK